eukprot:CAMPEP_0172416960 /NCGR_PEP_ID=MMETSP1064-20121228/3477_1 /TAXON_ID=202472 /ORGANISM="Aulacoseira subarctica , Strain CCAP 1002/5" /LENGTH=282 /DNA_ID=CAMNT_0013154977 /DNA_START=94 /DNA_END=942 /DNA_ORIENTATION=+
MKTAAKRLLWNQLIPNRKQSVDRLSRSCSNSNLQSLIFQQTFDEVNKDLPASIGPMLSLMSIKKFECLNSMEKVEERFQSRAGTSQTDLSQLIFKHAAKDADFDGRPASETKSTFTKDLTVDKSYWDMPSVSLYHDGMTVERKEAKERALRRVRERIQARKSKLEVASNTIPFYDKIDEATQLESLEGADGSSDENYWVWETKESSQPFTAEENTSSISCDGPSQGNYWDFPFETSYGGRTVAQQEERAVAMRRVGQRIILRNLHYWHWDNNSSILAERMEY